MSPASLARVRLAAGLRLALLTFAVAFGHAMGQTGDSALVSRYAARLPGDYDYSISSVAISAGGDAYLAGVRTAPPLDASAALQPEAFAARLNPTGDVVYLTALHGLATALGPSLALSPDGHAVIVGSRSFEEGRSHYGFVARVAPNGDLLFLETIQGTNHAFAAAVGPDDRIYVTGYTAEEDLPTTPDAIQKEKKPGQVNYSRDAFLIILSADAATVQYATYLGGIGDRCLGSVSGCLFRAMNSDEGRAVALDDAGSIYIAGVTTADDFPVTQGTADVLEGDRSFLTKLTPDASAIVYSVRYGGAAPRYGLVGPLLFGETPAGLAVDGEGAAYVAGTTYGSNFPTTASAAETVFSGVDDSRGSDGYLAKFDARGNLVFASFMPGEGNQRIGGFARLPNGDLLVSGAVDTRPPDWLYPTPKSVGFLAKLAPDASQLVSYQAFPPGAAGGPVAAFADGSVYIAGERPTSSAVTKLARRVSGGPAIASIANAASLTASGRITPGEILSIFGYELAPSEGLAAPATVNVLVDGVPAPVLFSSANQVNAIVPFAVENQTVARIEVQSATGLSPPLHLGVSRAQPALFTVDGLFAAALNEDGSVNSEANPARSGSVISLFGTGGGPFDPPLREGDIAPNDLSRLQLPVSATVEYTQAPVLYAGSAPGIVAGVMQINLRLPVAAPYKQQGVIQLNIGGVRAPQVLISFSD